MQKIKRIPVTREGFEKLQKELEELKSSRPQAVKTLSEARAMGDLSENGLYTAAKARLRSIDNQIFRLEIQIKLADIKESNGQTVGIGSVIEVNGENGKKIFSLVGDYEADPVSGKISQQSPLGRALIGKRVGENVVIKAPAGEVKYVITSIS